MVTLGAAVHSCARGNRPRQAEELCLGDVRVALKVVKWDPKKNVGGELKKTRVGSNMGSHFWREIKSLI